MNIGWDSCSRCGGNISLRPAYCRDFWGRLRRPPRCHRGLVIDRTTDRRAFWRLRSHLLVAKISLLFDPV